MSNPKITENQKTRTSRNSNKMAWKTRNRKNKQNKRCSKKELKEKINETTANVPKEVLLKCFFEIGLPIDKLSKRKKNLWKMYENKRNTQRCNNEKRNSWKNRCILKTKSI